MIAYKSSIIDHQVHLVDSLGNHRVSDNLQQLLNFLLQPHSGEFKVAWDLELFAAPMLRLLPLDYLQKLYEKGQVWIRESGHSITYNPKKSLYLTLGSNRAKLYHLKQFFGDTEPEPASLRGVAQKGELLLRELRDVGVEPKRLSSPVALIDDLLDEVDYPNFEELPDEVGQMAWECCAKPWTEATKIGFFAEAWDYDINSAYPYAVSRLLDLRYGRWVQDRGIPDEAVYGFARGEVNIYSEISPVVYANASGHLYNPKGKRDDTLPLQVLRFLKEFDQGDFKIFGDGWWWLPKEIVKGNEDKFRPFKGLMMRLFGHRHKSALLNRVMKRSSTGVYGKLLQTYRDGKFAKSFNPVYGAIAETEPKLEVARCILGHKLEDSIIHISTDGFLLEKRVDIENGEMMGEWRLDSSGPALVVSSGCLFYGDKRPNQLSYGEAMDMIARKPKASSWEKSSKRMCTMGDVLESGGLGDIGKVMPIVVGFGLKIEYDRSFFDLPSNGEELLVGHYSSKALLASKLSKPTS